MIAPVLVAVLANPAVTELSRHLASLGIKVTEGNSGTFPEEQELYTKAVSRFMAPHVCEIGFNAGHSAALWLSANPESTVSVFDLWSHSYADAGFDFLKQRYGSRITAYKGDSITTLQSTKLPRCDVISVDGGHDYEHALIDLFQFKRLAFKHTIGFIDDTNCNQPWCKGPNKAVDFAVISKLITITRTLSSKRHTRGVTQFTYVFDE